MQPIKLKALLLAIEKEAIESALKATNGNCAQAAKLLGINRTTLIFRRRKLGLHINAPGVREKEIEGWNK